MPDKPSSLVQGTLDMLILKTLQLEAMHGSGLAMRIEQISKGGYLDATVKEKMRRGMNRDEALRAARIEMGGAESLKEQIRAVSWESVIETLWQDLKFGLRLLRFNTSFAAAAILSLALGIGANTAIFQLLDAVRLRTLPVKSPQELARIAIDHRTDASGHFTSRYSDLHYAM